MAHVVCKVSRAGPCTTHRGWLSWFAHVHRLAELACMLYAGGWPSWLTCRAQVGQATLVCTLHQAALLSWLTHLALRSPRLLAALAYPHARLTAYLLDCLPACLAANQARPTQPQWPAWLGWYRLWAFQGRRRGFICLVHFFQLMNLILHQVYPICLR